MAEINEYMLPLVIEDESATTWSQVCPAAHWEKQTLVPKPNKPAGDPASYCPIWLLNTVEKMMEGDIYDRLLSSKLVMAYRNAGMDFVASTEHWIE